MRPTDFCHLNDLRVPVPRVFPAHYATFTAWIPTESWAPCGILGDRVFHDTRERFGGSLLVTRCHIASLLAAPSCDCVRERGAWALSSHGASKPIEPLTPLSPLPLPRTHRSAFATPSEALALSSGIAFPREEAAKVAVTTAS